MITLGQASNYSAGQVWRHLFATGSKADSQALIAALSDRYHADADHIALYHTGRSALAAALLAAKGKANRVRVIIPGLTCIAVVRAVRAAGCEPVFVDITRENLEYNYQKLRQELQQNSPAAQPASTSKTGTDAAAKSEKTTEKSAISAPTIDKNDKVCYNESIVLVQNTLGLSWDIQKIESICHEFNAKIVEDLAHSAGRFYADGREVGTVGAAAALSFGKGKAIDTISGGAVVIRDGQAPDLPQQKPKLADRLRDRWYPLFGLIARGFGRAGCKFMGLLVKLHFVQRSADAELDLTHSLTHWQAKLALRQLEQLSSDRLRDFRLVRDRNQLLTELKQQGYYLDEIWYDTPVSPARYAEEAAFPATKCPDTVKIAAEIINFPTWYDDARLYNAYEIAKKYEVKS